MEFEPKNQEPAFAYPVRIAVRADKYYEVSRAGATMTGPRAVLVVVRTFVFKEDIEYWDDVCKLFCDPLFDPEEEASAWLVSQGCDKGFADSLCLRALA